MKVEIATKKEAQDIWIKRSFDASKELVFRLFVEKDLQLQWQSAFLKDFTFKEFDCQNKGSYHSTHIGADGNTYGFKGVYHEVLTDIRIIKTSEFLGLPFAVLPTLEILTFEEEDQTTTLNIQIICNSTATRDAMVQHGMQAHFEATFNKMDELLGKL